MTLPLLYQIGSALDQMGKSDYAIDEYQTCGVFSKKLLEKLIHNV